MAIYLKQFSTHSEYEQYINGSGAILPNVSVCTTEGDVHYNPYVDPYAGHDYVEIGGLKWATMNIGANSITDAGLYFQWGDTQGYTADQVGSGEGQKYFGWADYKYCDGTSSNMTKYNATDSKTVIDASDNAVITNWGGQWRMPTRVEYIALGSAVNTAWTNDYKSTGVKGLVCTAKNGSGAELFFPAAGVCVNGSVYSVDSNGFYWSSSLDTSDETKAYLLLLSSVSVNWQYSYSRHSGFPVRGVVG